jgi:glutamate N-acetyltransferase/amino-acid N-acetyltransferase
MSAWIDDGGVTSPLGFTAGGVSTGIKTYGPEPRYDVGLLVSDRPSVAVGLFTTNLICGAPVSISRQHLQRGTAQAIVINSGCSNVGLGERGLSDAREMTTIAGRRLGIEASSVLVASTGVIGRPLPLDRIRRGIESVELSRAGGHDFSRAIMTTDRVFKRRALRFEVSGKTYTLGGTVKGSGMAAPNMATVLGFITTDAALDHEWAKTTIKEIADRSLNMLNVDMDTSTSDSLFWLANGAAGGEPIGAGHAASQPLKEACLALCTELTKDLARDGEGANALLEVEVLGARSLEDARRAAHTIVSSPLVKSMVTGRDPNIGRVLMAVGRSGAAVDPARISIVVNGLAAYTAGAEVDPDSYDALRASMNAAEVRISVDLKLGDQRATAWGCDLTEEYVRINASYTT